jgi:pentatricopeptide repeat protein
MALASSSERDLLQITTAEAFLGKKRIVEKL